MVIKEKIIKSNALIEARYSLGVLEQKTIIHAVSKLKKNERFVQFSIKEISEVMYSSGRRHSEIRKITNALMDSRLYFTNDEENRQLDVRWISSAEYFNGNIKLEFSDMLIPHLMSLKERFTTYNIENIMVLSNKYSIRLYELLKQYQKIGKRIISIENLKKIFILENKYKYFKDLEKRVIKKAVEEINESTDIYITYKKIIRTGKKIEKIEFIITKKETEESILDDKMEKFYSEILNKEYIEKTDLNSFNFNKRQIGEIYEIALEKIGNRDVDVAKYIYLSVQFLKEKENFKSIDNHFAYIKKMLKEDFYNIIFMLNLQNENK